MDLELRTQRIHVMDLCDQVFNHSYPISDSSNSAAASQLASVFVWDLVVFVDLLVVGIVILV